MHIKVFTFNPIQENTYVVYDDTRECVIIDAGCYTSQEKEQLTQFIERNKLDLKCVLNTHSHFDHVFGNAYLAEKYGVFPEGHQADEFLIENMLDSAKLFGFFSGVFPQKIAAYLNEGDMVQVGNMSFVILHVPGHSPGSVCFYEKKEGVLFTGDVLFEGSIGRTDLFGGNFATLINGITKKLLILPDQTVVYPGHGTTTTIANEKMHNPYL
ncbi:MAG: MBL fold metallo-hydrolase [Paludibacteraceae bacterium]|nr:MBL fold metallo-hydrolase [Paludibacteraceae bacterium]MBN2788456.1 MBL fold metallo-hydrolase [Paludibacteraceae bacterium]